MPVDFEVRARTLSGMPGEKLSDALYRTLKGMIVYGQIPASERLMPDVIAKWFGVSTTPVREALTRLAAERFTVALPRRGFRVAQPSRQRVIDLWQVRYALEGTAGELVIQALRDGRLKAEALDVLDEIQREIDRGTQSDMDHGKHVELNAKLHRTIVRLSGNQLLASMYEEIQLHLIGAWIQRGLNSWRGRLRCEAEEHRAIIEALKTRDVAAHRAAIQRHIDRSLQGALEDLESQGQRQRREPLEPIQRQA